MPTARNTEPLSLRWARAAKAWVELESAASLLEDTKSSVLSQMMMKRSEDSISGKEMGAKASQEWVGHVTKINQARREANLAKVKMEWLRLRFMEAQSQAATERVEARL